MIIKQNKSQTFCSAVFILLITGLFLFFVVVDFREIPHKPSLLLDSAVFFWAFRGLCAVFFLITALCTLYFIRQLFVKEPLIEICDDYLFDNSSAVSLGKINWDDIERAYIKGGFLNIKLKNPGVYFHDKNWIQMLLIKANIKLGYGDGCISTQRFQKDAKAFFEEFNKRKTIER